MYGDVRTIGTGTSMLMIAQLIVASLLVILLDELLNKGYGIGSGISLFISCNVSENILWKCISPMTISSGDDTEFEGCIINFFHKLIFAESKSAAL